MHETLPSISEPSMTPKIINLGPGDAGLNSSPVSCASYDTNGRTLL